MSTDWTWHGRLLTRANSNQAQWPDSMFLILGLMKLENGVSGHDASTVPAVKASQEIPIVESGILSIAFRSSQKNKKGYSL